LSVLVYIVTLVLRVDPCFACAVHAQWYISLTMNEKELNSALGRFISEVHVRNVREEEYRGNLLYEILMSIQHHLRENGLYVNLLENEVYCCMRKMLDAKTKDVAKKGIGNNKSQASVIRAVQEEILWEMEIPGTDHTPQKLLDTLVYVLGLNMALRVRQEEWNHRVTWSRFTDQSFLYNFYLFIWFSLYIHITDITKLFYWDR